MGLRPLLVALLTAAVSLETARPAPLGAQSLDLGGYALGVGTHADDSALGAGGTTLLGRLRVMPVWTRGPLIVDAAYEHLMTRSPEGGGISVTSPGGTGSGGDWLGTDWTIRSGPRTTWRHRLDRLSVHLDAGRVSVTVGRQAISWATTLFLTPADPFAPFDPSDPFRAYRGGVDAARVRAFTGPFTELEAVVRPTETPGGTTLTALGRVQTSRGGWAFGAWAGALHDEGAAALFATGALGTTAVRGELAIRRDTAGGATTRASIGGDRRFSLAGRDLYAVLELQHDGYGARRPGDLLEVAASAPYRRGDMQTLGRWTAAAQAAWEPHPLVGMEAFALMSLADGSALIGPAVSWSATSSASVRFGGFGGIGPSRADPTEGFASEYGPVPLLGYVSLSVFY